MKACGKGAFFNKTYTNGKNDIPRGNRLDLEVEPFRTKLCVYKYTSSLRERLFILKKLG